MKPILWEILKFLNVAIGLCVALWLISIGLGIFAIVLALYITYLNMVIDEILKGTDKEGR
jgi:hypothetical protein